MATTKKKSTIVAKKTTAKKAAKKPVAAKKIAAKSPAKKIVAKKTTSKKPVTTKKPLAKKAKKSAKPILKQAPAKKAAKQAAVVKAASKKLSKITTTKQSTKAAIPEKKKPVGPSTKNVSLSSKKIAESKSAVQKSTAKVTDKAPVVNMNAHQKELKKALKKSRANEAKPEKPFVMPKTNSNKLLKYEPTFIKSVLDHAPSQNDGPAMRYSDPELTEFKELITRKLETAKKELGYLQGLITRKDEMGGDETDNRYMTMEDGSLSMEREQLSQMASRQITFIDHLEKAMMRIENKTYGICRVSGKLIDKARLRAVPHATLSIEAKMGIAK